MSYSSLELNCPRFPIDLGHCQYSSPVGLNCAYANGNADIAGQLIDAMPSTSIWLGTSSGGSTTFVQQYGSNSGAGDTCTNWVTVPTVVTPVEISNAPPNYPVLRSVSPNVIVNTV